ncbi:hypothetical protein GKE82_00040 [Conexibacter sp. W3-3-2]|uniref:hypothetical protein n=1 Tax=Conexibacter sp. W3-3-2 TaxID=2675227 RepID=UPI0012B7B888|nr:hypothetical protein [Conexibacter sp. W3-3-2]MTD42735.1 hypothetical protein [Conexibacter sp. W3-3-2]
MSSPEIPWQVALLGAPTIGPVLQPHQFSRPSVPGVKAAGAPWRTASFVALALNAP